MAEIKSGAGISVLTVDLASNAARTTPYKSDGSLLWPTVTANKTLTDAGVPMLGVNDGAYKTIALDKSGKIRTGNDFILFREVGSSNVINLSNWTVANISMIPRVMVTKEITLNSTNVTAANAYSYVTSNKRFQKQLLSVLVYRTRLAINPTNGAVCEFGFGAPVRGGVQLTSGAFFRKTTTGQIMPVYATDSVDVWVGTDISASILPTNFYLYGIVVNDDDIVFYVMDAATGVLVTSQSTPIKRVSSSVFSDNTLPIFMRIVNGAAITPTPVNVISKDTVVVTQDHIVNMSYADQMASLNAPSEVNLATQLTSINWTNNTLPVAAVLSNTAPSYLTKGGLFKLPSVIGGATDYLIFSALIEPGCTFHCTGVSINAFNTGTIGAAGASTVLMWGVVGDNPINSLIGTTLKKVPVGIQNIASNAPLGTTAIGINTVFNPALKTSNNRYFQVFLRVPVGIARAGKFIEGFVSVRGYNE